MKNSEYSFDWSELAFASKKPLKELKAVFIAAPREISIDRVKQLIKKYLPVSNVIIGLAKEDYVDGFDGQPHFRSFKPDQDFWKLVEKVNQNSPKNKLYTLSYFQRETTYVIGKLQPKNSVFINGSWYFMFHVNQIYYELVNNQMNYEQVSPFTDENEAKDYEKKIVPEIEKKFWPKVPKGVLSEVQMLENAQTAAKFSFDYGYQTGVTIGKKTKGGYKHLLYSFNEVVPFQTYAMHHGAAREQNFSPPQDLNHYDAVHAEVRAVVRAGRLGINLKGTTLFINLLPCPFCARMFTQTEIEEFVYSEDHSGGYTVKLLEKAGKKVRRVVLEERGK